MKKKIGTIIDSDLFKKVKVYAAQENKPMNEIIQEAVVAYLEGDKFKRAIREHALKRLLSK
jgi:hypothetical protein